MFVIFISFHHILYKAIKTQTKKSSSVHPNSPTPFFTLSQSGIEARQERMRRNGRRRQIAAAINRVARRQTQRRIRTNRAEHVIARILAAHPGVVQTLERRRALINVVVEHGQQEVGELGGVARRPLVLLGEHLLN